MFSLNGLKNIKIILIVSLLSFSLLSFLLFYNFFEKSEFKMKTNCSPVSSFQIDTSDIHLYTDFKKACEETQNYNHFSLKIKNDYYNDLLSGAHFYHFKFDKDSYSYLKNLYRLNKTFFSARKRLSELNKSKKDFNNLINEYRKQGKLNFDNEDKNREQFKNSQFALLNDYEKFLLIHTYFSEARIKHNIFLDYYSFIYTKIFDNNDYVYHYVIFLNFITLLFLLIFFYKIIKILFPSFSQILTLLVVSNVVMCPITIVYFLSFYKEPLIILSMTMIIFNYVYFLTKKINLKRFIYCTFIVIISFFIIRYVKYEYTIIYMTSFLLSIIILNLYKKNRIFFSICLAQCIVLIFVTSFISPNFNLDITKQRAENVVQNILYFKYELTSKDKDRAQKEKRNINSNKINPINDFNYYTPEVELLGEKEQYLLLECFDFIKISTCKRINNFSYRLFSIKKATLWENDYFKSVANENIVNASLSYSAAEVLMQIPISAVRGYFMPLLLNSNILVTSLTVFKLIGSFLLLYISYFYYKNKPTKYFLIIFGILIIFLPLVAAVDLVTSNYFTYFRYVYPFNIILLLIVFSFIVNQILELKND